MAPQHPLLLSPSAPLAAATGARAAGVKRRRSRPWRRLEQLPLVFLLLPFLVAPSIALGDHQESQLFSHEFTLPEDNVARGLAYVGTGKRIGSVLKSLQSGRAVHLGVIGGSITWGHGA